MTCAPRSAAEVDESTKCNEKERSAKNDEWLEPADKEHNEPHEGTSKHRGEAFAV